MIILDERYPRGFVGNIPNFESNFLENTDDEKRFLKNCETQPSDWVYRNKKITYKYNEYGHRCVSPNQLKPGYILYMGCSFTDGVGLALEDTYPFIVSNNLNKTYYNVAVGGSGPIIALHNTMLFLSMMGDNKPDCVIVQWPNFARYSFVSNQYDLILFNCGSGGNPLYKELIMSDVLESTNIFIRHSLLNYLDNLGIKRIIELMEDPNLADGGRIKTHIATNYLHNKTDKARDLSHSGIMVHADQSKEILRVINLM